MLDFIIFGGAALFVGVLYFALNESKSDQKVSSRIKKIKGKTLEENIEDKALSLRRKHDASLDAFGLDALSHRLSVRLQTAGMEITTRQYVLRCLGLSFAVFVVVGIILTKPLLLSFLLGFVLGFGVPHIYTGIRISKRQRQFLRIFPDAIELIVRGLRAGLPVAESLQNVVAEIPDPVAPIFADICDQIKLGVPMETAMANVAEELKLKEFNFFVISITLQRETGGNLGEILSNLAEVLRSRHIMQLKIKALSSEARASGYIIGALPFCIIGALMIVDPEYLIPLYEDYRGNIAAIGAFLSLCTGLFIMNRMTKFKI